MVKTQYVDVGLLEKKICESGLKKSYIAEQLGISKQAFAKKCQGITAFRLSEVFVLCVLLKIQDDEKAKIFSTKVNSWLTNRESD